MKLINYTEELYNNMASDITLIAEDTEDTLQLAELSYLVARDALEKLKDYIKDYTFKDEAEEIKFFKEIKPRFVSEVIYYSQIFLLETDRPMSNEDVQRGHLLHSMAEIEWFFKRNNRLHTYHRLNKTYMDEVYFKRGGNGYPDWPERYSVDMDANFSTVASTLIAEIIAYEQFKVYLQNAIEHLGQVHHEQGDKPKKKLTWTDSKADLYELAYALFAKGSFNHGKADVKQIMAVFSESFSIPVGNFYRSWQTMRIRNVRFKFLDKLKDFLGVFMDRTDNNPKKYS